MGNDLVRCPHCFVVSEARYIVRRGSSFLDRHTCKKLYCPNCERTWSPKRIQSFEEYHREREDEKDRSDRSKL